MAGVESPFGTVQFRLQGMEADSMQAFHRLFELIRLQLQGLTLNAKLLIGSLMVILVMSLFHVSI